MSTVIIAGSSRKDGDTERLTDALVRLSDWAIDPVGLAAASVASEFVSKGRRPFETNPSSRSIRPSLLSRKAVAGGEQEPLRIFQRQPADFIQALHIGFRQLHVN